MCFSIPLKITKITKRYAILENGSKVYLEKSFTTIKVGTYVRVQDSVIVDSLTKQDGEGIRKLIKELQINYEA